MKGWWSAVRGAGGWGEAGKGREICKARDKVSTTASRTERGRREEEHTPGVILVAARAWRGEGEQGRAAVYSDGRSYAAEHVLGARSSRSGSLRCAVGKNRTQACPCLRAVSRTGAPSASDTFATKREAGRTQSSYAQSCQDP